MSDSELIIRLLKAAEKRMRGNRMLHEIASGLAIALLVPVLFKVLDFFVCFRLATVSIFFVIWGASLSCGSSGAREVSANRCSRSRRVWMTRSSGHDQLKTAYWFIRNPKESAWVELQIRRAAASARSIAVNRLYPRSMPRASYLRDGPDSFARPSEFHAAALEQQLVASVKVRRPSPG